MTPVKRGRGRPKTLPVTQALDRVFNGSPDYNKEVPEPGDEAYQTKEYLESRTKEIDIALVMACKEGNAQALKIAYQLQGKIKEDDKTQKVKVSIDGTDLAKELLRARRELDKAGMAQVRTQPSILHQQLREAARQSEHFHNTVPDVAVSERPAE